MDQCLGEIKGESERATILRLAVEREDVNKIVEIGTLDGTGSTKVIIESLNKRACNDETHFITVEANRHAFELASCNLEHAPKFVKILHGCLNDRDTPLLIMAMSPTERNWFDSDLQNRFNAPNVKELLPNLIDLAVLDGGEFTSFNDYLHLRCRCRYIFLDDCNVRKNRLTLKVAAEDGYSVIHRTDEGNGAVLLEHAYKL